MKVAVWSDGSTSVRKTHTRDYKYAYRVLHIDGVKAEGFSETYDGAIKAANQCARRVIPKPTKRSTLEWRMDYKRYVKSEEYQRHVELESNAKIEIVGVA